MKKILTVLLVLVVAMCGLFAATTGTLQLNVTKGDSASIAVDPTSLSWSDTDSYTGDYSTEKTATMTVNWSKNAKYKVTATHAAGAIKTDTEGVNTQIGYKLVFSANSVTGTSTFLSYTVASGAAADTTGVAVVTSATHDATVEDKYTITASIDSSDYKAAITDSGYSALVTLTLTAN